MSFGKMNTFIELRQTKAEYDSEGFVSMTDVPVASVRAYREGRHGSEKWANLAAFSDVTDLLRFRVIPGLEISTTMRIVCGERTFEILSVEDVKGRGMYLEVLAREVVMSG